MVKYEVTEYKDSESYEKDKAKLFDAVARGTSFHPGNVGIYGLLDNLKAAMNLLKQSKWVDDYSWHHKPNETQEEFIERIFKESPKFISIKRGECNG